MRRGQTVVKRLAALWRERAVAGACRRPAGVRGRDSQQALEETPANMSGRLISKGEPVGASHLGQVVEIVTPLRGDAGARQVPAARTGLAHVLGAGGNCAITVLQQP